MKSMPPIGRIAASLAALAAAGLIDGCDVFGPADRLAVRLPETPPHWQRAFARLCFELEYPGPGGELSVAGPFAWGTRVTVACSKEANGAFLAWPLVDDDRRRLLRPAGGLYPLGVQSGEAGDELALTWADGCLAVVMLRLAVAGRDPALVNAARLGGYLAAGPDPWCWDLGCIEERLAEGGFTVADLERLPTVDAVVQPGEGEWFLETPFSGPLAAGSDGMLEVPGLFHGLHTLFGTDGRRVRVFADGRGVFTLPMGNASGGPRRTRGRSTREAA
jgi:hypothetical protein